MKNFKNINTNCHKMDEDLSDDFKETASCVQIVLFIFQIQNLLITIF